MKRRLIYRGAKWILAVLCVICFIRLVSNYYYRDVPDAESHESQTVLNQTTSHSLRSSISPKDQASELLNPGRQSTTIHHQAFDTRPTPQLQIKVEIFPVWTTKDPQDTNIIRRLYLYSAIVALHGAPSNGTEIHFVAFQDGRRPLDLICCAKLSSSHPVHSGQKASVDFSYKPVTSDFSPFDLVKVGVVYRCMFPFSLERIRGSHVTLAPTSCPEDMKEYLNVHQPVKKPGGLAICAKIAYGFKLNPEKLLEWFEMQRLLGVDRIQLFDLNNTETVYKIFQHYQKMGLLDLLPYKLPGRPWGRFILKKDKDYARFGDDEELSLWDCRLRLAGHDYVMDIDTDEVIMPRSFTTLKPFLKEEFARYPTAASLHFMVQFFLDHWAPVNPQAPLLFLRYLSSTYPRVEVSKHVYIPGRTHQAITHIISPYQGYQMIQYVPPWDAVVLHYRSCKKNWKFSCDGPRLRENAMLRFRRELLAAVSSVRRTLKIL